VALEWRLPCRTSGEVCRQEVSEILTRVGAAQAPDTPAAAALRQGQRAQLVVGLSTYGGPQLWATPLPR
jgi:hypothetical protein